MGGLGQSIVRECISPFSESRRLGIFNHIRHPPDERKPETFISFSNQGIEIIEGGAEDPTVYEGPLYGTPKTTPQKTIQISKQSPLLTVI